MASEGLARLYIHDKKGYARLPVNGRDIAHILAAMLGAANSCEEYLLAVDLFIVNDGFISLINSEYLDCKGPTNILSFPGGGEMPGTLFLSTDTLFRESFLYGQDIFAYFVRLLGHGFGHLAGHEHGLALDAISGKCIQAALACKKGIHDFRTPEQGS